MSHEDDESVVGMTLSITVSLFVLSYFLKRASTSYILTNQPLGPCTKQVNVMICVWFRAGKPRGPIVTPGIETETIQSRYQRP